MPLHYESAKLRELALEAFGEYVSSLYLRGYSYEYHKCQKICENLQDLIRDTVPSGLADEVTAALLKYLTMVSEKDIRMSGRSPVPEVVTVFVSAIIHPAVNRLDFSLDISHTFYRDREHAWDLIVPYVYPVLKSLKKLKVFSVMEPQTQYVKDKPLPVMETLEEFTFMGKCHRKMLKQLSVFGSHLKKLNVHNSHKVDDNCISILLQFPCLEDLGLYGTYINEVAMTNLLNGLAEKKVSGVPLLKSFECSNLTAHQFSILVNNFTNLTKLKFAANYSCDFELLKGLKHLKVFSIKHAEFVDICKIVRAVGSHLISFHFGCSDVIDPVIIAENCTYLECLHIQSHCNSPPILGSKHVFNNFKSIRCLYLTLPYAENLIMCFMSHCTNVRVMKLQMGHGDPDAITDTVLRRNPLSQLKELTWFSASLSRDTAKKFVEHCPKLTILCGKYIWTKHCNLKKLMVKDIISENDTFLFAN